MKKVAVYCASSQKIDNLYLEEAARLGKLLSEKDFGIVYGGGKVGLMGTVADAAMKAGGHVSGVIPEFMINLELAHKSISELNIVEDMHTRQKMMLEKSDYIIALPGGSGTFMEFFEAVSWKRLGLIVSPIILLNINGYYDNMIAMLNRAVDDKFMAGDYSRLWNVFSSVSEAVDFLTECRDNAGCKKISISGL